MCAGQSPKNRRYNMTKAKISPVSTGMSRDALNALIKTTRTVARKSSRETDERLAEYSKVHAACN